MKLTLGVLLLLTGCASGPLVAPAWTQLGLPPYKVGEVTVVVLDEQEVKRVCRHPYSRGCYKPWDGVIYTTADVWALLHEVKHAVEGEWHR